MRIVTAFCLRATVLGAAWACLQQGAWGAEDPAAGGAPQGGAAASGAVHMPEEADTHARTWMAYGATAEAWGTTGGYGASRAVARRDLMRIAAQLSRFESVSMLVSDAREQAEALGLLTEVSAEAVTASATTYTAGQVFTGGVRLPAVGTHRVTLVRTRVNDLWLRDTGPVFVRDAHRRRYGVSLNFNGWGQENTGAAGWTKDAAKVAHGIEDQAIGNDVGVAAEILRQAAVPRISTWLVMEGGGIEVNGKGTALCTESCILNANRNPGRTKAQIEVELKRVLGIAKVIWLPGRKAQDITDAHIDFYARFVGESTVVYALDNNPGSSDRAVTLENKTILEAATDARGQPLTAIPLLHPSMATLKPAVLARNRTTLTSAAHFNGDVFAAGYVGFYLANGCVLLSQFGDPTADLAAFQLFQRLYPTRKIVQFSTDGLANAGGTIHCATQQEISP